jgi:multicomponent Na+:H+ antiporter subunit E
LTAQIPPGCWLGWLQPQLRPGRAFVSFRRFRDGFEYFPLLLGLHFIWGSIVAGVDVAWRAFHPRLPLRPGFVTYACRIPAGTVRDLFLAMTSLMPGSLPTDVDERGVLLMHSLDTEQPLADQMADNEARLLRALEERTADA